MKRFVLLLFVLLNCYAYGQDGLVYSKFMYADSVGKAIIFDNVKAWFGTCFHSAKDTILHQDKKNGMIIGKASIKYSYGTRAMECLDGNIYFDIKTAIKDNSVQIILSKFTHKKSDPKTHDYCEFGLITNNETCPIATGLNKSWQNQAWVDMKSKIEAYSKTVFSSLGNKLDTIKKSKDNK